MFRTWLQLIIPHQTNKNGQVKNPDSGLMDMTIGVANGLNFGHNF